MSNIFESLSDVQRSIVFDKKGKFVVRACPGSGKTYSVAARLARLIGAWDKKHQGIAAISFTNAAWQEIRLQLETHFGITTSINYPHFLGTIDSFINQNIFLLSGILYWVVERGRNWLVNHTVLGMEEIILKKYLIMFHLI